MGKGGGSDKSAEAARITGEEARKLNQEQTIANRPNQSNSWGSTKWNRNSVYDPVLGENVSEWEQIETLNPELQKSLDAQLGTQRGRSELAQDRMGDVGRDMANPMDFQQYGDVIGFDPTEQRQTAEDNAYQKSANRLDSRFGSQSNEMEINLRNKGLRPGDQAYDSAMDTFGRSKNDAYEQARLGATAEGRDEYGLAQGGNKYANELRRSQIEEDLYKRGHSLDEVNRLLDGQQVQGSTPSGTSNTTAAGSALKNT